MDLSPRAGDDPPKLGRISREEEGSRPFEEDSSEMERRLVGRTVMKPTEGSSVSSTLISGL
jgi:hypothetical protein